MISEGTSWIRVYVDGKYLVQKRHTTSPRVSLLFLDEHTASSSHSAHHTSHNHSHTVYHNTSAQRTTTPTRATHMYTTYAQRGATLHQLETTGCHLNLRHITHLTPHQLKPQPKTSRKGDTLTHNVILNPTHPI